MMKRCSRTETTTRRDVERLARDWGRDRHVVVFVFGGWSLVGPRRRPAAAVPPRAVTKHCQTAATSCSVSLAGRSFPPPRCFLLGSPADSRRATRDWKPETTGSTDRAGGQATEIGESRNAMLRVRCPRGCRGWMKGPGTRIGAVALSMPTRLSFGTRAGILGHLGSGSGRVSWRGSCRRTSRCEGRRGRAVRVRRTSIRGPAWASRNHGLHRSEHSGSGTAELVAGGFGRAAGPYRNRLVSTKARHSATAVASGTWRHRVLVRGASDCRVAGSAGAGAGAADTAAGTTQQDSLLFRRPQRLLSLSSCPTSLRPWREETGLRSARKQSEKYHQAVTCLILLVFSLARYAPRPNECSQARMGPLDGACDY